MNGKKLKALREARGLTLKKLGEEVGVSHVMIQRIEMGTKDPSIVLLKAIAAALGVTAGELIDEG